MAIEEPAPSPWRDRFFLAYLMLTALVGGGLIMVIEVLGSRVIGPFFGVSLFVWTSLIAVTLMSLAIGYAFGGVLADRHEGPGVLYGILFVSGVAVLLIPHLKAPILAFSAPLGLRLGAFVSTTLLFSPSLILLGMLSPFLIKVATSELASLGRTVGGFYALSTIGSVVGTTLTGFVLIAYLGISTIFQLTGIILILLAIGYFTLFGRAYWTLLLLIVPTTVPGLDSRDGLTTVAADGTRITLVGGQDDYYGSLKVVDYSFREKHHRELVIDGLVQGGIDMRSRLSIYAYSYLLQYLPTTLSPGGERCLVIGLGAGVVPMWYESRGITTDVVDINPGVVDVAERYFGFRGNGAVLVEDARYFLERNDTKYDYVVLDVFTGDTTPGHLLTLEALTRLAAGVADTGVIAINLVGALGDDALMTASVVATLRQVMNQVTIYPLFPLDRSPRAGNMVIVAYRGARRSLPAGLPTSFSIHPFAREEVARALRTPFRFGNDVPWMLLTDDYNPIDVFDKRVKEMTRRNILETTDWEVLIRSS